MLRGNQHGGGKYDDLQNWLDMMSHEKPLLRKKWRLSRGQPCRLQNLVVRQSFWLSVICHKLKQPFVTDKSKENVVS